MKYTLHKVFAFSMMAWAGSVNAQSVSTFEDVTLPGPDTSYLAMQNGDGVYPFTSGNTTFYGSIEWGFWGNFNCSNGTDTVNTSFAATPACIAGKGQDDSDNYGIVFVPTDFMGPDPTATIPVGAKLLGNAAGHLVAGVYATNAVYAYRYMLDGGFYANNQHWFKLVVRGYSNGVQNADSVIFTLADFSNPAAPVLVNTWEWVDLSTLGQADSLTFDLISSDAGTFGINTPAYFAIDNLSLLEGGCPQPQGLAVTSLNENSATIGWDNGFTNFTTNHEIAVDESATPAPTGIPLTVTGNSYVKNGLNSNTLYYAHIRSACDDGSFSAWDTVSFRTLESTAIFTPAKNNLELTISPNPAQNFIDIHCPSTVSIDIFSVEGKHWLSKQNASRIDISGIPAGIYFLKAFSKDGREQANIRFVKTK